MHRYQLRGLLEMSATVAQRTNELARRGFTLVELLVVLVLLAVLFTLAAPNFLTFRRNAELTSAANSFVASLSTARAEAMKRQLRAFVVPTTGNDWATGWRVFVDVDSNVTASSVVPSGSDIIVVEQAALPTGVSGISVVSSTLGDGTTAYVMFNGSGFMTKVDKTFADMSIELSNGIEGRRVIVNPNGRLRVCKPPPADTTCTESAL